MLLRKLGKRGTAIIEYVILLSFVAVIGTSFTSDAGMGGSIKSIITNVEQMLGLAAGKEESKGKFKVDDSAQQYADFVGKLVDNLYAEMMKYTDKEHPPENVWINANGYIDGFKPYGKTYVGMHIYSSSFLPPDCPYEPRGGTRIFFDEKGNIINVGNGSVNDVSRIFLKNIKDDSLNTIEKNHNTRFEAKLTFNSSTGSFGNDEHFWKE